MTDSLSISSSTSATRDAGRSREGLCYGTDPFGFKTKVRAPTSFVRIEILTYPGTMKRYRVFTVSLKLEEATLVLLASAAPLPKMLAHLVKHHLPSAMDLVISLAE